MESKLVEKMTKLKHDPLGFVLYSFAWGSGELASFNGPDEWQSSVLSDIGDKLKSGAISTQEAIQIAVASGHGIGKILSNKINDINTPDGIKKWSDISVGDRIFGSDGNPTTVTAKYPHTDWDFYKVSFSDGSFTYAGLEHQWTVSTRDDRYKKRPIKTVTTQDMIGHLNRGYQIPMTSPVQYEHKEPIIAPYLLGYILGNGSLRTPSAVKVSCYDTELYDYMQSMLPEGHFFMGGNSNYQHISRGDTKNLPNILVSQLIQLGIYGKLGGDKFIPDLYKFNSVEVRIQLLRGLMDSDGTISTRGGDNGRKGYKVQFSTSSEKLRNDIIWIVKSLGGVSDFSVDSRRGGKCKATCDNYEVHINLPNAINPFHLERKRVLYDDYVATIKREPIRVIREIEYDHTGDGHCITVDAHNHLYLANDFIVTHNSALVSWIILWAMSTKADTKGVVTANTETQLKTKTWAELAKWNRLCITQHWFNFTATALFSVDREHEKTWRIDMVAWSERNTEAFAGLHNKGSRILLIFDEASAIHDTIWEVSEGALTDSNTEIIWCCFGNPTQNIGRFRECFGKFKHRWNTRQIDSRTVAMTNKVQLQKWVDDYGEDHDFVRVRVRGVFPSASANALFSHDAVEAAMAKEHPFGSQDHAAIILGVDVARQGPDSSAIARRQGMAAFPIRVMKIPDTMLIASQVAQEITKHNSDACFVDETGGYGAGVIDALRQINQDPIGVQFGGTPLDRRYFNKRSEMAFECSKWITAGGALPDDAELKEELCAMTYTFQNDKFRLCEKDDVKDAIGRSPDKFDALILTFAFPVSPKHPLGLKGNFRADAMRIYDPYIKR